MHTPSSKVLPNFFFFFQENKTKTLITKLIFFAVSADYIYFCTSAAQSHIPKTASKYDKNRKQNTHRLSAETQSDKELMETITILYVITVKRKKNENNLNCSPNSTEELTIKILQLTT